MPADLSSSGYCIGCGMPIVFGQRLNYTGVAGWGMVSCNFVGKRLNACSPVDYSGAGVMKKLIGLVIVGLWAFAAMSAVTVTNVVVSQYPGSKLVNITYDVFSTASNSMTVSLAVYDGTNEVIVMDTWGAVGTYVTNGPGKTIFWYMDCDWYGNASTLDFSVRASENTPACPVAKTGQTVSYQAGDDGDLKPGMAWPNPRFTDNGDGTVTDNLTGLEWLKAPHSLPGNSGATNWPSAIDFCNELDYAGHSDWRLPNIRELESLVNRGSGKWGSRPAAWLNSANTPFSGVQSNSYWSGSSYAVYTKYSWYVNMNYGDLCSSGYSTNAENYCVWPVRGGSPASMAPVPKTGQTVSCRAGDDGDLEAGVTLPNPRFADYGDGRVADNLTGLEWAKAPHSLSGNSGATTWSNAIDFCNNLVYAGHSDWRMPSFKELLSLQDYGRKSPSLPIGNPFSGLQHTYKPGLYYWSSTSAIDNRNAVLVNFGDSFVSGNAKTATNYYVWPVRSRTPPVFAEGGSGVDSRSCAVDSRDYILTVSTEYGSPTLDIGQNYYAWQSTVSCEVDGEVTSGLTNWTCAGWSGSGSVPASGDSNYTGEIVLTDLVSSITWNWNTNYWLDVVEIGSGSVNPASGWYPAGENVSLSASPSDNWRFMGWNGDVSDTNENIIIPMVNPVSVAATFIDPRIPLGGGATFNNLHGIDSDGDGMTDLEELVAGTSPTNSDSVLVAALSLGSSANEVSWHGVSGRYYRLEYTDNLANGWTPKNTVIAGEDAQIMKLDVGVHTSRFYRVRVSESPDGL